MLVKVYAAECAKTNVRANLVDPGEDPMSLPAPEDVTEVFVSLAEPACARTGEVVLA